MFHKRGLLPLPPVENPKLRSCTSVVPVAWNASAIQQGILPVSQNICFPTVIVTDNSGDSAPDNKVSVIP